MDLVAEVERRVAGLHALQANAIAELAGRPVFEGGRLQRPASDHLEAAELVAAEVGAACCWSRSAASARVHLALDLVTRLPATMGALAAGSIDLARARVISEAVLPLAQPAATAVEQRVLPRAGEQTTAQLG
ncbi:MAG: 13E12 repeat family protein, partial [Actinomycetota bacterium]|nr:13E12 repeat family protein [Actinomycetota bacterium]